VTVTFVRDYQCPTCGCRNRGFLVAGVRVGKDTLRTVGVGVGYTPTRCVECRAPLASDLPDRTVLEPGDAAKVDATRARRGWTA
jgi:hypothetical protein